LATAFAVSPPQSSARSSVRAIARVYLESVEAAAIEWALAQQATRPLGELGARGPADVVAPRALVEGGAAVVGANRAPVAAAQALHLAQPHFHVEKIGVSRPRRRPSKR
jgi:hypothetical protein